MPRKLAINENELRLLKSKVDWLKGFLDVSDEEDAYLNRAYTKIKEINDDLAKLLGDA